MDSSPERLFDDSGAPAVPRPAAGDKCQGLSSGGGSTYERLLERYGGFFEELGYGCLASFKHLIEQVEVTIDTATSNDVNLFAKLHVLKSARASVEVFTEYYSRFLPPTVVNNLRADLTFLLERAEEVVLTFG
ncbi:MAG: hypothetical protein QXN23_01630 [Candidatus Caldarchaeum sp.]|uniref:Uncharacterized protein n=1 Tax=Caldiarchaeum subterraneum TaxID=311458 RepID=A0A7C4E228_CALS0